MTSSVPTRALVIFVKNLVPGSVKTRIARTMGNGAALSIYQQLLERLKNNLSGYDSPVYIYYSNFIDEDDFWNISPLYKRVQSEGDLGQKMFAAFREVGALHLNVLLIGSDCPEIDIALLDAAYEKLETGDLVFGPCTDGGYYLIGMKNLIPEVFEDIPWSTDQVLIKTLERIKGRHKKVHLLPESVDVDEEKDFLYLVQKGILKGL